MQKNKNKKLLLLVIFLIIILSLIGGYFISKKPKPQFKNAVDNRVIVNVIKVNSSNYTPTIKALGKVEAAEELSLMSEVNGKIIQISKEFVPGGIIKKGQILLEIDPIDYKIALSEAKSNYIKAQAEYRKAIGKSQHAKEELKVFEKNNGKKIKDTYLALRKPELEQAKANLEQAQYMLDKAKLNLKRCKIIAPFNLIVKNKSVSCGSFIGVGTPIATLINTDKYWVNVSMPINEITYVEFNDKTKAIINLSNQPGTREASFFKVLNYLDYNAHFMGILFTIYDPLLLNSKTNNTKTKLIIENPKIFLDDYVTVNIKGKELNNVFKIPLFTVKINNIVWVVIDDKLIFTKVDVVYKDNNFAYVKGLKNNDLIVNNDLPLATNNMPVKILNTN